MFRPCRHCRKLVPSNEWLAHQAAHKRENPVVRHRSSAAHKRERAERLARVGNRCEQCGSTEDLELHSPSGHAIPKDGVVLCIKCHPRPFVG